MNLYRCRTCGNAFITTARTNLPNECKQCTNGTFTVTRIWERVDPDEL